MGKQGSSLSSAIRVKSLKRVIRMVNKFGKIKCPGETKLK